MGAAAARALAERGARLSLCARSAEELRALAAELPVETLAEVVDVADPAAARRVVGRTLERFGRLDALVNNAGVLGPIASVAEADPALWRYAVEVNLLAPLFFTREALPALRESAGRVVNVSTGAAVQPIPIFSAYCASKAGLTQLNRVLALEEPAVTFVCLSPGVVDTSMQEKIRAVAEERLPEPWSTMFMDLHQRGMLTPPDRPGRIIAWMALHAPREWSGQMVDGDDPALLEAATAPL